MNKRVPHNKGNRRYTTICGFCKKEIKASISKKFCNRTCYFKSEQFLNQARENGEKQLGKRRVLYRISWGYKYVMMPEHPKSSKQGYIPEHRIVAEKKIGRILFDDEVVHHINENKKDNSPENLLVLSRQEHARIHITKDPTTGRIKRKEAV